MAAERFIAARRARVERLFRSRQALEPMLGYLGRAGCRTGAGRPWLTAVEELVERYRRYLLVERMLTVGTARVYVTAIRPFLESFEVDGHLELHRATAADVSAFGLSAPGAACECHWPSGVRPGRWRRIERWGQLRSAT